MAGINFLLIPTVWKDCTGYSQSFASEQIEVTVGLPAAAFATTAWVPFTSPRLREALFHEASHYIDRALYHLIVGKHLVSAGRIAWGLVAYYYSSFFAAQAAIRLKGIFFVKVNYDSETNPPPTHRLEVVNLLGNQYRIRRMGREGSEHRRVWNTFYEEYGNISGRANWARYAPITAETDPELQLVEMHQRHLINYVPGRGYLELRSPRIAQELQATLEADIVSNQAAALGDDYLQLEMRAFLRLRLCLQLLTDISHQHGVYEIHHAALTNRRRTWLDHFDCPSALHGHITTILV
jgi:hypothetical protein